MKKNIIIILLCIFFNNKYLSAQTYYPLLDSNKLWNILLSNNFIMDSTSMTSFTNGDTIINSEVYEKVFRQYYGNNKFSYFGFYVKLIDTVVYAGAIREDTANKKIFFLAANDSIEKLLYDFSLSQYDTVIINFIALTVDSIVNIEIDSTCRKRYYLSDGSFPPSGGIWIEGIGSVYGLLNPIYYFNMICPNLCSPNYTLLNVLDNNDTIYDYSSNTITCIMVNVKEILDFKKSKIIIFPNPANNLLTINIRTTNNKDISVKIVNLLGKEIFTDTINNNSDWYIKRFDMSKFSKGLYTVNIKIGDEKFAKKFIIN